MIDEINELVELELNVSKLYKMFSKKYIEDYNLWWELSEEEERHASILEIAKNFLLVKKFSHDILPKEMEDIKNLNLNFQKITDDFYENGTRRNAFDLALNLENSTGEVHYQLMMTNNDKINTMIDIFKKLNKEDINHAIRIQQYMKENNI